MIGALRLARLGILCAMKVMVRLTPGCTKRETNVVRTVGRQDLVTRVHKMALMGSNRRIAEVVTTPAECSGPGTTAATVEVVIAMGAVEGKIGRKIVLIHTADTPRSLLAHALFIARVILFVYYTCCIACFDTRLVSTLSPVARATRVPNSCLSRRPRRLAIANTGRQSEPAEPAICWRRHLKRPVPCDISKTAVKRLDEGA